MTKAEWKAQNSAQRLLNRERIVPGTFGKNATGGSSTKLGKNLLESMNVGRSKKWSGYQAQHIIPKEFKQHPVIQKIGMDMDDASNGIFLREPDEFVSAMSRHQGYHGVYSEVVQNRLNQMDINQSPVVLERQVFELQQKLKSLQEKGLPLYMNNADKTLPIWKRGGGATEELWERWLDK